MVRDGIVFKDEDGQVIFNQYSFCELVKHLLVELVGISYEEASQIVDRSPLAEPVADAKQSFTVSEFKKQMADVFTTSVNKSTLDECPMAYKGMQDILDNIGPTAEVVKIIRPIYNFKAGDED